MTTNPPKNEVIPVEIANVIIERYDSTLILVEKSSQIYGKALDGKGIVEYKNGNRYEGEFTNGMLHGNGTFYWTNGVTYTGTFQHNQITGSGKYSWPDGSWYDGDINLGLRHGRGRFATAGEDCIYDGEWKDGLKHGQGIMTFKSGTVYEGSFERGLKHGYGKITYPSGNYYEGEWAFDKKQGQGTMYWADADEKYTGGWVDNKQEGWGVHIWLEQKSDAKFLRNRYEGEWRNGLRNGVGVFYYSNGSRFEGEWIDNLKEGFAIFTYDDGRVFTGMYHNDKMVANKDPLRLGEFETNESRNPQTDSPIHGASKLANTLSVINENRPSIRKSPKKTTNLIGDKAGETNAILPKPEEIELNPYDNMLEISDLFVEEDFDQVSGEILEVKNLLLRHHANLKLWYRNYSLKQQTNVEESFALTSKMFWKMLRDTKVLSPKVTIAAFNRLFLQGAKNDFALQTSQNNLRKKLYLAKRDYIDTLPESEQAGLELEAIQEEELFVSDTKLDVHDENRVIFFRHFVDGLVRVAYLKYGGFPNFAKKIEQVLNKIKSSLENKKKPKSQVEEEHILVRVRGMTEQLKDRLKEIFHSFPTKEQLLLFNSLDYTMTVKNIVDIFEECGIIKEAEDQEAVLHFAERTYDPEDCFSPPTDPIKDKSPSKTDPALRMQKLGDLLNSEVVFLEFYDIFLLSLFRNDGNTAKEDEVRKRSNRAVESLEEYVKQFRNDQEDSEERGPRIYWPYSQKDYMFEHLTVEKEKREREIAHLKQKKLEREHEEKESKAMEKEDYDVSDEYLRPATKQSNAESGDYAESYNDF